MQATICILKTDGINCDQETAHAFQLAGGLPTVVHINEFLSGKTSLLNYGMLVIPGGFSYGDDLGAGVVLANELNHRLGDQLRAFLQSQRPLMGICNGFQVLVKTHLLGDATLTLNLSGKFDCRWVELMVEENCPCVFTEQLAGTEIELPIAHAEGRFVMRPEGIVELRQKGLVVMRYKGCNPNGSMDDIAAVCDSTGLVIGLMPHPECYIEKTQHPNWRRVTIDKPHGLSIFESAVKYLKSA